jgi:uncharacterized linocin/CFP29 family protein
MDRNVAELNWNEEQWNTVVKTVADEAQRARVAASFLPLFGPLDASVVGVPNLVLSYQHDPMAPAAPEAAHHRICVDSEPSTLLTTISVTVAVRSHEVADPELSAALGMFRRAANVIARVEDALLLHGQVDKGQRPAKGVTSLPPIFQVSGGRAQPGLVASGMRIPAGARPGPDERRRGDATVGAVVQAVNELEAHGHSGPFACVLGHELFEAVCTPTASLVLPRDRILPFLNGPLVRTSIMPTDHGLIVALGGNPVEIVVGSDISVRFLQTTAEPRYLFRVAERVALRVREWSAVAVLDPDIASIQVPDEPWRIPNPPMRDVALRAAE